MSGRYQRDRRPANRVRAANPLFLPENLERAGELIAALREVAEAHAATPAQIALAWVIHHPAVTAIPGASSVEQVESNAAAADIKLTDDQYQAVAAASDRFRPVTGRAAALRLARAPPLRQLCRSGLFLSKLWPSTSLGSGQPTAMHGTVVWLRPKLE